MDKAKRERLEAAGFRIGDAEEFLGLTEEERRLVELRLAVSRTVRRLREQEGVTQKQLAAKLKSSQSRVAKIEAGSADVSLDLLFRALFATGGSLQDLAAAAQARGRPGTGKKKRGSVGVGL
jgi:predicted XRE-type DNA-binding protein